MAELASTAQDPRQAFIRGTPRNPILGYLSDLAGASYSPQRTQQMQGVAQFFGAPAISQTLNRLAYGEPLTTGAGGIGGTSKLRPEVAEAAMSFMDFLPTSGVAKTAAMAAPLVGGMMMGKKSATWDAMAAAKAKILADIGTDPRTIWKETGTWKGPDGKWRQEIDANPQTGGREIGAFDPRFDNRVLERERISSTVPNIVKTGAIEKPSVSLVDFEGRPFITSMSDRTAAGGNLIGINDVEFNRPVELKGGQDFMFNNPGQVWASAQNPVNAIMKGANEIKAATGQNPLFLPWRMAPTGGDFAAMTGETMLAYADSAMNKKQKKSLDKSIKKFIPDWVGVSDPASVEQFRNAPDQVRKTLKGMMDVNFRNEGGLNIGQARLSVADPTQLIAQDAGVMNVGEIFAGQPVVLQSGHPSYPRGVPGQGIGTLIEDRNIFELMPEVARARGIANPAQPGQTDIRALQMKPYAGVISEDLLKRLGY